LKLNRVTLRTNAQNKRSQAAIERLGAVREGVLRDFRVLADGTVTDALVYGILASEWPNVKARLEDFLSKRG
jgi:N-acetyltransferase